jgi:ABC-type dipeptide/oligopeptide/nickel transport system ATPase component
VKETGVDRAPAGGPLLEVDRLSIRFPASAEKAAVRAVQDLSFTVGGGEIVGLIGESGSGKTLTSLALLGLAPAAAIVHASALKFEGRELAAMRDDELRRIRGGAIGFVFQEPMTALNPVLTIGDQITEAMRAHLELKPAAARRRALELLEFTAHGESRKLFDAYPHQLSGGQRQRAMLVIAIAAGPRLLIADEPTSALDALVQAQILALLARLRRELGLAILLISHDLGVVAGLCDRVLVLRAGELVEEGSWEAIASAPSHPYTRELVAAARAERAF